MSPAPNVPCPRPQNKHVNVVEEALMGRKQNKTALTVVLVHEHALSKKDFIPILAKGN